MVVVAISIVAPDPDRHPHHLPDDLHPPWALPLHPSHPHNSLGVSLANQAEEEYCSGRILDEFIRYVNP